MSSVRSVPQGASDRAKRRPRSRTRALRGAAVGAGVYLLLWVAVNSPLVGRPVLERARSALALRVTDSHLGENFSISPLGNVRLGPLRLGAADSPTVQVESLILRPKVSSLFGGKLELSALRLVGVDVDAGRRGAKLEALWEELQGEPTTGKKAGASKPKPLPEIQFRSLRVHVDMADARLGTLSLGPVDGRVRGERGSSSRQVDVVLEPPGGGAFRLELTQAADRTIIRAAAQALTPQALPPVLQSLLPVQITQGHLEGTATVDWPRPGPAKGSFELGLTGVFLRGERLAAEDVGPISVQARGTVRVWPNDRRIVLEGMTARLNGDARVEVALDGQVAAAGAPTFEVNARAPALDYQALLAALPPTLRPGEDVPRVQGAFGAEARIAGPVAEPWLWEISAGLNLEALRKAAKGQTFLLNGSFSHRFVDREGVAHDVRVGPDNGSFIPLAELPEILVKAVTVSEDAGFFGHPGFDFSELKNAIAEGAEAGRIVRGGSTISQQLSKNLFLSRQKTFSRKVQEALATVALESAISKRRMLEIYLNLIEWGPNLYGIGPAARHYFGKDARDLTVKEAVFLATIIPNPVRYHVYFARKSLTENWEKRIEELLGKLYRLGVISEDEYENARTEALQFAQG
jgi:penicillin-binding protein 1A